MQVPRESLQKGMEENEIDGGMTSNLFIETSLTSSGGWRGYLHRAPG